MRIWITERRVVQNSWAAVVAVSLLLSMAAAAVADDEAAPAGAKPAAKAAKSPFPEYKSNPANGATTVDPSLKEIVIRFDRKMGPGMSITGDPTLLPPIDSARKPGWRDARTFVLPVTLAEGAYYRIGINSKSHQNFRDSRGTPAPPTVIAFTTKGASKELIAKVATPQVVSTEPKLGAKDVDAGMAELKVTFDLPMGGGMSFVGDVPAANGGRPAWSKDRRTIALPIKLEPGQAYRFGLNSPRHVNFQSEAGVPLEPVAFEFSTAAAKKE